MLPQSSVGVLSLTHLHARVWAVIQAPQYSRRQGPRTVKKPSCLNPTCSLHGNVEATRIIRYGFYRTTAGKRRRYRCVGCGQTFSTTKGTPYYRLQHRRATFDTVVTLRVEGVSLSAIARMNGWPGTPLPAGSSGPPPCVADIATGGPPASLPQSCKPTRSARSLGARPGPRGYLRRLRSGRVSGRRPSSDDAATGTPWHLSATSRCA